MRIFCWSALPTGAIVTPGWACDICSVFAATHARGGIGKGFFGGVAGQFTHFGTWQEEGRKVPNPVGQQLYSPVSRMVAGYTSTNGSGCN
ncbi:MAG: hypothetical protein HY298_24755 [Verrucomicrobia bacterium]|nr:hypothetical protein [Verrucomicrobiota bacterium]